MDDKIKSAPAPSLLTLSAPAKVNIFLRVLSKRSDGYHEIFSLMQPLSLSDEITLEVTGGGIDVQCSEGSVPQGPGNIAYSAAKLFFEAIGEGRGAGSGGPVGGLSIRIEKNIPAGAGLGGGSSDAAAVLLGLNELFAAGLGQNELMDIGARIGSDVPFFILGGAALARGRGEVLTPVELPPFDYLLINPGFEVSTGWVYSNLGLTKERQNNMLTVLVESFESPENIKDFLINDLEDVTIGRHPEVAVLKRKLLDNGATGALMSGSGPTVFGLFPDTETARRAFTSLTGSMEPGCKVFLVKGLPARSGPDRGGGRPLC
ncbi:MAG: 4-(cytidine 5'-diphospho)-2-C-methyl-D-erythritol kinase [Thermodesulfobacteriota bacterium]